MAVALKINKKLSPSQRQKEGVQMIEHLLLTKKRRIRTGVMFTQANQEAIDYIIKNQPTCRVTRNQKALMEAVTEEVAVTEKGKKNKRK